MFDWDHSVDTTDPNYYKWTQWIFLKLFNSVFDPRVNKAESEQIVDAIEKNHGSVTYVVYSDEGHGFARPENRIDFNARAEKFLSEHLGGRFEQGAPRDELTALAATLDGLLGRIEAALRHEQRFSAEMAHELRTPLAGVRAEAELALSHARSDDRGVAARTDGG